MTAHREWHEQGERNGWTLPPRPFMYRLPIIKRLRYAWDRLHLDEWYSAVPGIPTGFDEWCLYGWWHGLSRRAPEGGREIQNTC